MKNNLAVNLRQLRQAKQYTQEQVAEKLGVSVQSVSRWECGTTYPDIMLLPQIARLYDVLVDDLYQDKLSAYDNYAQRLFAVYESSKKPEDFLASDREFRRLIRNHEETTEDLRLYGILHQIMMNYCRDKALELFDQAIQGGKTIEKDTVLAVRQQRQLLMASIGRGEECVRTQLDLVENGSGDFGDWILLLGALSWTKNFQAVYEWFRKAVALFPEEKLLYVFGGDACEELGNVDEAFRLWDKALELDPGLYDVRFSKGFYYEKHGEYQKALDVWTEVVEMLRKEGYESELEFPMELARKCEEKLKT